MNTPYLKSDISLFNSHKLLNSLIFICNYLFINLSKINLKNMKEKVYIFKRKSEEKNLNFVLRALKFISMKKFINNSETKILINPNWVISDHFSTGNITSTDTLEGIISYLIQEAEIEPRKIIVADGGSFGITDNFFKLNDLYRLEDYGIELRDLNNDEIVNNIKIPYPLSLKTVNIAKIAIDASCILSVPSLKTHNLAKTTLSMKNMMGTIMPKSIMHSNIHKKIADLVSLLRSKMKFQLIDGIIGSNGSELGGNPVKMDLIIAGEDPVAVDLVGSLIMGFRMDQVKYLKFGEQKGLGITNLDDIEIIGKSIAEVTHKF